MTGIRKQWMDVLWGVVLSVYAMQAIAKSQEVPQLHDERLELTLFAEDPEIVTPIGMAVDERDRVFVIESHTHQPPSDYGGPKADRVKVFWDEDFDGRSDHSSIFAEGIQQAMNLAFSPEGELYVVCAREVLRLVDEDRDGKCDRKEQVLALQTEERYSHNSLLGLTFDREGWMYVSRGNTGSHAYRMEGPDGSFVEGYGDGGSVIRCRPDGTQISEYATGFWNPFDLKFDRNGRLLLVDNDPDARGPNRMLHVLRRGDYGYKSLYGGSGNHPFQGWNAEWPGALPFLAGTGEAPSGLLDCRRSSLPSDYEQICLVTIWNENSIEWFQMQPRGASVVASRRARFISGSKDFRPVAIDCDSRGNIYITDWVLVDYPNHGRGKIWRVSTKDSEDRLSAAGYFEPYLPSIDRRLVRAIEESDEPTLRQMAASPDLMIRHRAVERLALAEFKRLREDWRSHEVDALRLAALLASRRAEDDPQPWLNLMLADPNSEVRLAALLWAGDPNTEGSFELGQVLSHGANEPPLFDTYLAAEENRAEEFLTAFRERRQPRSNRLVRKLPEGLVLKMARDEENDVQLRSLAISRLRDEELTSVDGWLASVVGKQKAGLAMAVIRKAASGLARGELPQTQLQCIAIALDANQEVQLRAEALWALAGCEVPKPDRFVTLLHSDYEDLAIETARTFRAWFEAGRALECKPQIDKLALRQSVMERLAFPADARSESPSRPATKLDWYQRLSGEASAERGRRVFFSAQSSCSKCHTIGGRGGTLGPDLGQVSASKSRQQIIDAILEPSAEFAPQYQAWLVVTSDGQIHRGLQLDHKQGGKIILTLEDGSSRTFEADEIEDYRASPNSLMPDGLADQLTLGEFRDLLEFLSKQGLPK